MSFSNARTYWERGYSIFPLEPTSKKPLFPWEEYQHRRPTEEEMSRWYETLLDANIAIVTGRISGIVVIDIDSEDALKLAQAKGLPAAPMVKTAKGWHVYCKYREGVRNFQKRADLPGIDLRGDGGYVVAPRSLHETDVTYEWVDGHTLDDLPLPELPDWILAKNESEKVPLKDLYDGVQKGERNNSLARLAGSWASDGLSLEQCLENARIWNSKNNPPMAEKELYSCVKSIWNKHKRVEAGEAREALEPIVSSVAFDFSVFPKPVAGLILKIAEAHNINAEPPAVLMLSILSAALGNSVRVSPKPGWEEPVFLWSMIAGESGSGKTPFASKLFKPVYNLQAQAHQLLPKGTGTVVDTVNNLELQPQYLVSDITVEALAVVLGNNPRGVIAYFDELAGFIKSHDRYSSSNERQKYLELWNCQPWQVNRISRGAAFVKDTGLSICGGIQLSIIPNIFDRFSMEDGLLPRFLFTLVKDNMGYSTSAVTDQDMVTWNDLVMSCFRIAMQKDNNGYTVPTVLKLDEDAHQIFGEFNLKYRKMAYYAQNKSIKVFLPKLISYALRIAGVLHVMSQNSLQQPINGNTMTNSIKLVDYFLGEVRKILILYSPKDLKCKFSETQKHLIRVLWRLKDQVKNGMLATQKITVEYNQYCQHPSIKLRDEQAASYALKGIELSTKISGGHSHLIWEPEKIQALYTSLNPL